MAATIFGGNYAAQGEGLISQTIPIRVGAAPHVSAAAEELARQFWSDTGTSAVILSALNNDLTTACAKGDVDIVMPSQVETIEQLARRDLLTSASIVCYAREALMLCQREGTTAPLSRLEDLGKRSEGLRVVIPDPGHSEHGAMAKRALEVAGVFARVSPHLLIGVNTRDAVALLASGKADAAILPAMHAMDEPFVRHAIPDALAPAPQFKLAICARARSSAAALQFSQFLESEKAAPILAKHGFSPCAERESVGDAKSLQTKSINR